MVLEFGQNEDFLVTTHRVSWFAPDRPVEGCTVFVRPSADESRMAYGRAEIEG
jgi:hypothetical protein